MNKEYVVKSSFNGNYLEGAIKGFYFIEECRYWTGDYRKAKLFTKEKAEEIAGTTDFGVVEKLQ